MEEDLKSARAGNALLYRFDLAQKKTLHQAERVDKIHRNKARADAQKDYIQRKITRLTKSIAAHEQAVQLIHSEKSKFIEELVDIGGLIVLEESEFATLDEIQKSGYFGNIYASDEAKNSKLGRKWLNSKIGNKLRRTNAFDELPQLLLENVGQSQPPKENPNPLLLEGNPQQPPKENLEQTPQQSNQLRLEGNPRAERPAEPWILGHRILLSYKDSNAKQSEEQVKILNLTRLRSDAISEKCKIHDTIVRTEKILKHQMAEEAAAFSEKENHLESLEELGNLLVAKMSEVSLVNDVLDEGYSGNILLMDPSLKDKLKRCKTILVNE